MIIYRLDLAERPVQRPLPEGQFEIATGFNAIRSGFIRWVRNWGWRTALMISAKVLSGRRAFFYSLLNTGVIAQTGWANIGFCRYYPVEPKDVVFGKLITRPEFRNRGYSTAAKSHAMSYLYDRGHTRFYSDTSPANIASQRTSEKLGFTKVAVNDTPSEPD